MRASAAIAFAAATIVATGASADQLDYLGMTGGGVAVKAHHTNAAGTGTQTTNTWAGRFEWHNATTGEDFVSHCIELTQYTPGGLGTYTETSLLGLPAGSGPSMTQAQVNLLAELFEDHGVQSFEFSSPGDTTDLTQAAAMQMAIWEIVYESEESTLDVNSGNAWFEGRSGTNSALFAAALSDAQTWLNDLDGTFDSAWLDRIRGLASDENQDQIIMVPLPAPALLAGLGLIGVGVARRRRLI